MLLGCFVDARCFDLAVLHAGSWQRLPLPVGALSVLALNTEPLDRSQLCCRCRVHASLKPHSHPRILSRSCSQSISLVKLVSASAAQWGCSPARRSSRCRN
eukprot:350118-Chlamydomonas_euryale.AAC.3